MLEWVNLQHDWKFREAEINSWNNIGVWVYNAGVCRANGGETNVHTIIISVVNIYIYVCKIIHTITDSVE